MASIEKRGDDAWRVVWRHSGRKHYATLPTEREAELGRQLVEMRHSKITSDEVYEAIIGNIDSAEEMPPTVGEFANQWIIERRRLRQVQEDVLDGHHRVIMRHILPKLGTMPITGVTREVVTEWVAWLIEQPSQRGGALDADTVRRSHATLHGLLGAAVPRWLPMNPAAPMPGEKRGTALPKSTPHEPVFLTAQEIEIILASCDTHIHDLVFTAVRTGLRLGELLALEVQDVTVTGSRKAIHVRQALKRDGKVGPPKSRRSRRTVSIPPAVTEVLKPRVWAKKRGTLVFAAPQGERWVPSNLRHRHWAPALARAQRCAEHPPPLPPKPKRGPRRDWRVDEVSDCDCPTRLHRVPRFHDLRHTHVSLCAEAGWEITKVSRRVGHESIQTTADTYRQLWEHESTDALDAVERLLRTRDDEDDEVA